MAIAFDNATGGNSGSAGTTYTLAHTATGSNGIIVVQASCEEFFSITGVTWDGNAMTQVGSNQTLSPGWTTSTWYYFAGTFDGSTHNVISTCNSSKSQRLNIASYTGVNQTAIDSYYQPARSTANPYSLSTTVVGSGCWLIADAINNNGNMTAGSGTTSRVAQAATIIIDSNGIVSSGSQTLNIIPTSGGQTVGSILSILPASTLNISAFFNFF